MTSAEELQHEVNKEFTFWQRIGDTVKNGQLVFMIIGSVFMAAIIVMLCIVMSKQMEQEARVQTYQTFRENNIRNQESGLQLLKHIDATVDSIRTDQLRWHYEGKIISNDRSVQLDKIQDAILPATKLLKLNSK